MAKYKALPVELFKENRRRFCAQLPKGAVAIFYSNDPMPRSGDTHFTFRQNADLFYLSGLDQEETILVLFPNCPKGEAFEEVVFTKRTNDYIRTWEGYKYTQEQVTEISGIETVFWTEGMDSLFNELILLADVVYVNGNENDRAHHDVVEQNERKAAELRSRYPLHRFERCQPIMKRLRMIKSLHEVEAMQKACDITDEAFRRVLATTKPGMMEYEVEAEIIYTFIRRGANGHAYNPIIASGANACVLHYNDNCRPMNDGDVLLLDFGAEYANYAADLSRSIPVNGRFSPRQKAVYEAVLRVKKAAEAMLVPGNNLADYHYEVGKVMENELIGLGLLDRQAVAKQNPNSPLYKKYFMHGTSHHLGLDVHDLCERYVYFEAGMVFTCEPGIYIPEEGLGIRLEDDILITEKGPINLMSHIPLEVDEIEGLMNAK
jgi:Xaa-Pro aminopeptidase